jgi:hypothetical protein
LVKNGRRVFGLSGHLVFSGRNNRGCICTSKDMAAQEKAAEIHGFAGLFLVEISAQVFNH